MRNHVLFKFEISSSHQGQISSDKLGTIFVWEKLIRQPNGHLEKARVKGQSGFVCDLFLDK